VALLLCLPRSNDNHLRHPLARLPVNSPPPHLTCNAATYSTQSPSTGSYRVSSLRATKRSCAPLSSSSKDDREANNTGTERARERERERAREVQSVCIRPGIIRLLYLYGFFIERKPPSATKPRANLQRPLLTGLIRRQVSQKLGLRFYTLKRQMMYIYGPDVLTRTPVRRRKVRSEERKGGGKHVSTSRSLVVSCSAHIGVYLPRLHRKKCKELPRYSFLCRELSVVSYVFSSHFFSSFSYEITTKGCRPSWFLNEEK
jgi:hypothetical protein